jgi:hypothetical protein
VLFETPGHTSEARLLRVPAVNKIQKIMNQSRGRTISWVYLRQTAGALTAVTQNAPASFCQLIVQPDLIWQNWPQPSKCGRIFSPILAESNRHQFRLYT